jgi:hypothetical protein
MNHFIRCLRNRERIYGSQNKWLDCTTSRGKRTAATFEIRDSYKAGNLIARLPQQYAPLVYGIIQAAITTAVATAIATHQLTDFRMWFVEEWLFAWGLAFLTMLPVVIFVSPFIQRCVLALTVSTADDG